MDLPQPLHPRVIDDLLLGDLPGRQSRLRDERDVSVNRIVRQAFGREISRHGSSIVRRGAKQGEWPPRGIWASRLRKLAGASTCVPTAKGPEHRRAHPPPPANSPWPSYAVFRS